jgi:hypothetical protein
VKQFAVWAFVFGQIFAVQASAQTALFNTTAVTSACSRSAAACDPVVDAQITALKSAGLDETAINEQLALLAAAVIEAIQSASPRVAAAYAAVLERLAGNSTDAIQAAAIRAIGLQVAQGNVPTVSAVAESLGPISDN